MSKPVKYHVYVIEKDMGILGQDKALFLFVGPTTEGDATKVPKEAKRIASPFGGWLFPDKERAYREASEYLMVQSRIIRVGGG